jgi:photosystem II stability/assembly factor-like uncharacterized protein
LGFLFFEKNHFRISLVIYLNLKFKFEQMKSKLIYATIFLIVGIVLSAIGQTPSWNQVSSGFSASNVGIEAIYPVDTNIIWAIGYDGSGDHADIQTPVLSTDGGITWTELAGSSGVPTSDTALAIFAANADTLFTTEYKNPSALLYKSFNGGSSWSLVSGTYTPGSFADWGHFFDSQNGVVLGDPKGGTFEIYTTSDGGGSWSKVSGLPVPLTNETGLNDDYSAIGNVIVSGTTTSRVYRSNDQGNTWSVSTALPVAASPVISVAVKDSNTYAAILQVTGGKADQYPVYLTQDGGNTWSSMVAGTGDAGNFMNIRTGIAYVPGTNAWVLTSADFASGSFGSVYSTNNGSTWTTIDSAVQHTATPRFLSPTKGWSGGFSDPANNLGMFLLGNGFVTGVHSVVFDGSFKTYPNPSSGQFMLYLNTPKHGNLQVNISNATGQVVASFSKSLVTGSVYHLFNLKNLSKGIYFLQIQMANEKSTKKIIIQ